MIVLDTSALFAALVPDQPEHAAAARVLLSEPHPRVLSPFVLAELSYLLSTRGGHGRELDANLRAGVDRNARVVIARFRCYE